MTCPPRPVLPGDRRTVAYPVLTVQTGCQTGYAVPEAPGSSQHLAGHASPACLPSGWCSGEPAHTGHSVARASAWRPASVRERRPDAVTSYAVSERSTGRDASFTRGGVTALRTTVWSRRSTAGLAGSLSATPFDLSK